MNEVEWLLFPIRNEQGFRVTNFSAYRHMINTIVEAQVELHEDYPDHKILVVYETGDD